MTLKELFEHLLPLMKQGPGEDPQRELRLLMSHVTGYSYEKILLDPVGGIPKDQVTLLKKLVQERLNHKPLAKILGNKEFWGLNFVVSEKTLDPRPDSETLVEAVLERIKVSRKPWRLLDLGTGTGCLLLSVLHHTPDEVTGIGADLSEEALQVAQRNARLLGLEKRCQLIQSNWFENITGQFDIILSNPPYIDKSYPLSSETLYDPPEALFAENKGLAAYEQILGSLNPFLSAEGRVYLEIGFDQLDTVSSLAQENGYDVLERRKDLGGNWRCLVLKRQERPFS